MDMLETLCHKEKFRDRIFKMRSCSSSGHKANNALLKTFQTADVCCLTACMPSTVCQVLVVITTLSILCLKRNLSANSFGNVA